MKKLFILISSIILTASIFAQSPEKMSYQAVIRNSSDALLIHTKIGMQISILQGSTNGTAVYTETQSATTNANGLASIEIGEGITNDDFSTIDWANGSYFIKTEIDPDGGTTYTIVGTSQLLSTPYALHAKTAETLSGGVTETDPLYTNSQAANITGNDIFNLKNLSGTNTGDQDLSSLPTKAEVDALNTRIAAMEDILIDAGLFTLTDNDGNKYKVVTIGTQVWMAENLNTSTYNDGTAIPLVTDDAAWSALVTPGYTPSSPGTYGALYNGYAVFTYKLCPVGWHVPSDTEWKILTNYLGGYGVAGGKLKETGTTHWDSPNTGATNETGFTALPGGYRSVLDGQIFVSGGTGFWWSASDIPFSLAWKMKMQYDITNVYRLLDDKASGNSVRCLKD